MKKGRGVVGCAVWLDAGYGLEEHEVGSADDGGDAAAADDDGGRGDP